MINEELISKSPLRILEKSTQGGVGKGNIGIIAARKGVGKTACLVHIATDQLIQGKHVIHVSFAADTAHITAWYKNIFEEMARRLSIADAQEAADNIARNRVIMSFKQEGMSVGQVQGGVKAMIREGRFAADVVVVDGYDFSGSAAGDFAAFKALAEELQISIWFSATTHREDPSKDAKGVPTILSPYMDYTAILILMEPRDAYIHLHLVKDHDVFPAPDSLHLKLDPQAMLIAEEPS